MLLDENAKLHREEVTKYSYYIIGLAIAAIGYTISKTVDYPVGLQSIPIAFAILSWGFSIFSGLTMLNAGIAILRLLAAYDRIKAGGDPISGNDYGRIEVGLATLRSLIEVKNEKISFWGNLQRPFFFVGILCFLVWYVWHVWAH